MKFSRITTCAAAIALSANMAFAQGFSNGGSSAPTDTSDLNAPPAGNGGHVKQGFGGTGLGDAIMFAVIGADGSRNNGKGDRSATKLSTGTYEVIFWRNISSCGYFGTVGNNAFGSAVGLVTVVARGTNPAGVFVRTYDASGVATDLNFKVLIVC